MRAAEPNSNAYGTVSDLRQPLDESWDVVGVVGPPQQGQDGAGGGGLGRVLGLHPVVHEGALGRGQQDRVPSGRCGVDTTQRRVTLEISQLFSL